MKTCKLYIWSAPDDSTPRRRWWWEVAPLGRPSPSELGTTEKDGDLIQFGGSWSWSETLALGLAALDEKLVSQ